jgi:type I restriction enzyme M protein
MLDIYFFTQGKPTKDIWFYQHQLPENYKAYSKTKPIQLKEFEPIRKWWNNREESEQAWQVSIDDVIKAEYAIFEWKNPNAPVDEIKDPETILKEYNASKEKLSLLLGDLKSELTQSLFSKK